MSFTNKQKGYQGEMVVVEDYANRGYVILEQNFTVRGGEIDLIVEDATTRIFVEVKRTDYISDLSDFISKKKLQTLRKTIETYNRMHQTNKLLRVDAVFVRKNEIFQRYENIELG